MVRLTLDCPDCVRWTEGKSRFVKMCKTCQETLCEPSDETTWHKPCYACGHVPGCAWVDDLGFAQCPECQAD